MQEEKNIFHKKKNNVSLKKSFEKRLIYQKITNFFKFFTTIYINIILDKVDIAAIIKIRL